MIILCDLDGIVVDLHGPWLAWYNERWEDSLTHKDITNWDFDRCVKPECGTRIYEFINADHCYRNLPPLPGAIDGIAALRDMGHDVVFVTAASRNPLAAARKIEWAEEHLGVDRKGVMIAHRKELVRGDVLIDDSPINAKAYRKAWPTVPILTIAYPYNAGVLIQDYWRFEGAVEPARAWLGIVDKIRSGW